jgi:hypothetical protein
MNATELADELDGFLKEQEQLPWGTKQVYLDQAATMLRQQQAEIETLKQSKFKDDNKVNFELTDEEIRHIQAQCHLKDVGYDGFIMRFARAILRKAQEK